MAPSTMHPAEVAKRVGMSEAELRSVNAIPARMVVRAGSSLLVPRSSHMLVDVSEKVADNGQLSLGPEIVFKRSVVRARKGDNVSTVARRYKVNAEQLAQWNKTTVASRFKPGQQVVIMQPVRAGRATAVAAPAKGTSKVAAQKTKHHQTVQTAKVTRTKASAKPSRQTAPRKPAIQRAAKPQKPPSKRIAKG